MLKARRKGDEMLFLRLLWKGSIVWLRLKESLSCWFGMSDFRFGTWFGTVGLNSGDVDKGTVPDFGEFWESK
jgi:hypothetical protein